MKRSSCGKPNKEKTKMMKPAERTKRKAIFLILRAAQFQTEGIHGDALEYAAQMIREHLQRNHALPLDAGGEETAAMIRRLNESELKRLHYAYLGDLFNAR